MTPDQNVDDIVVISAGVDGTDVAATGTGAAEGGYEITTAAMDLTGVDEGDKISHH